MYSEAVVEKICDALAGGLTLKEVYALEGMPAERTVHTWHRDNSDFAKLYVFAMQRHCHFTFDRVWEIAKDRSGDTRVVDGKTVADSARVQRDRLIVDTGLKRCAKLLPTVYGDLVRLSGPDGGPIQTEELSDLEAARRIMFVLAKGVRASEAPPPLLLELKPEPSAPPPPPPAPQTPPLGPDIFHPVTRPSYPPKPRTSGQGV